MLSSNEYSSQKSLLREIVRLPRTLPQTKYRSIVLIGAAACEDSQIAACCIFDASFFDEQSKFSFDRRDN